MLTLYMAQLGGRPKGRLIEQHDIFFGVANHVSELVEDINCLLYTSPSPRDRQKSRMPSSA